MHLEWLVWVLLAVFGTAILIPLVRFLFVSTPDREPSSDVAGRVDDKYEERMGERLPDDHVAWTDSMEPTGYRVVVGGIHFVVSARMFDSVDVGDDVTLTAEGGRWGEIARVSNVAQGKSSVAMTAAEFQTDRRKRNSNGPLRDRIPEYSLSSTHSAGMASMRG